MANLRIEFVQLEQSLSQIESHQVEQDDVVQALEEYLEEVKSIPVLKEPRYEGIREGTSPSGR